MAPETYKNNTYNGEEIDLFSSGVILFRMYDGDFPFNEAIETDLKYQFIVQKKFDEFWQCHQTDKPEGFYSEDFKDFIEKALAFDPRERMNIS